MSLAWRGQLRASKLTERSLPQQSCNRLAAPRGAPASWDSHRPVTNSGCVLRSQTVTDERPAAVPEPVSHGVLEKSHIRQIYTGLCTTRSNDALQRDAFVFDSTSLRRREYCRGISPYFTPLLPTRCTDSRPGRSQPDFTTRQSREHT
jgi:hypothetical protein